MNGRIAISKNRRFEIFKRDSFKCQYCGAIPDDSMLEVDHIVPVVEGGTNDDDNLVTACFDCNRGKAARSLDDVPQSLADRAAETKEREEQLQGYYEVMQGKRDRIEDEAWRVAEIFQSNARDGYSRANFQSIKNFLQKLSYFEVEDAAEIAAAKKPYGGKSMFTYFCGICWNKIRRKENG